MSEYIDRQAVLDELDEDIEEFVECDYALKTAKKYIKKIPPADVQSVVLCSKCRYCQKEDEYTLWCTGFCNPSRLVRPDDFCSHGEAAP